MAKEQGGFWTWTDMHVHRETLAVRPKQREVGVPQQFMKNNFLLRSILIGYVQRLSEFPVKASHKIDCLIEYSKKLKATGFSKKEYKNAVLGASRIYLKNLMITLRIIAKHFDEL